MTSSYQDELLREIGEAQMTYQEFLDYLMPVSRNHEIYQQIEEACKANIESVKDRKDLIAWLKIYSEAMNASLDFRELPDFGDGTAPPPRKERDFS